MERILRLRKAFGRLTTIVATVGLLAGAAACGSSSSSKTVTLDFFQYKSEAASWFTAAARSFEKLHPNIKINVTNSASADTDLRTRLVKGRVPDVLTVNGAMTYGTLAATGVFHDWTGEKITKKLNKGMLQISRDLVQADKESDKKLYALPYAGNASGYIINKTLWRKAGLDPDNPPTTWKGFIAALKQLKAAGITPVEASWGDPWTLQAPLSSLNGTLVSLNEYDYLRDGTKTFKQLWTEVAKKEYTLYTYAQTNKGVTYSQATQDFANGKAGILPLGTYAIPQVKLVNKNIDLTFAQMPATNNASAQKLVAGADVLLTMSASTKHEKEARMFINYLLSKKMVNSYAKAQYAFTPLKNVTAGGKEIAAVLPFFRKNRIVDFCDHQIPSSIDIAGYLQSLVSSGNTTAFTNSMQTEWDKVEARTFR